MKFIPLLLLLLLTVAGCGESNDQSSDTDSETIMNPDTLQNNVADLIENTLDSTNLPERVLNDSELVLDQVSGDLDKDGIPEMAVVFITEREREIEDSWDCSEPRELVVYKQKDGEWIEWSSSLGAIYPADGGGMMGDPYDGITIKNNVLEINHWGGSSWKWSHTDKYRFQNDDFYLIGYSSNYGKPCEYWEDVDYNLSTGNCQFNFTVEPCEDTQSEDYGGDLSETFNHKMENLPKLSNRDEVDYRFESPNGKTIYL